MLKMSFHIDMLLQKVATFWPPFETAMDTQEPHYINILRVDAI